MSEENIKHNICGSGCKRYTIPRKQRLLSEDCQRGIPLDSREAKEIINTVHHLTWESAEEFDRNFVISKIYKVENQVLEREFQTKRTELRDEGRSTKELSEHYAFKAEHYWSTVKEQCMRGVYCNDTNSVLGDGKMGVSVWKCPDLCLKTLKWPVTWTVCLIIFRIVKGKVKPVTPQQPNQDNKLEPTPNYDCHVAKNVQQHSSTADLATLMTKTQYYLYEYNEEGLPRDRPRQCLPFAVIHVKKVAPAAQHEINLLEAIPSHPVSEDGLDTSTQDTKVQYLTEDDGKMAWRGLIGNKESSLGVVAIKAGHKLGLTLWKSFIDVRSKLPLSNLVKVIPGDIRTAWNRPLQYRGHTYSLCMVKPCGPADKFVSFIKSLSIKDHAAGVVTVDSSTVMFLVPSSKLSVDLGFCEDEEPWRMFCIVRRRLRRCSPSDTDTQSYINTHANQPTSIEPQELNISWRFEVPNLTKGIEEVKVIVHPSRPVGLSVSRSKSVDCTNTRSTRNTLQRTVSDTGSERLSPLLTTPGIQQPILLSRQPILPLLSTPPPTQQQQQHLHQQHLQQPSQTTHPGGSSIKSSEEHLHLSHDFSKKVSLFRFDNIPFLEHTGTPLEVNNNKEKHVTGGNHGDDNYDVTKEQADEGSCSSSLASHTQKIDVRNDKYHKHRRTLVPCTNSSKIMTSQDKLNPLKASRLQESNMTKTESIWENKNNDKTPTVQTPSRELSPRSFGVYAKHKETLKRKLSSPGSERENVKKQKLDFVSGINSPQDTPDQDLSCRGLSGERSDVVKDKQRWTSGLQVIELVLIEQDFQIIDETVECLEKQNAFEILGVDSVNEITELKATTMEQIHDLDLGTTNSDGKLARHSGKHNHVEENGITTGVTHGCKEGVQDHALGCRDDSVDMKPVTSDLTISVCCTLPSVRANQQQHIITMSGQDHTMSRQEIANNTISSQGLTKNTSPFLNEKENYKTKSSDSAQSEWKAKGSSKCVSDAHNRSIPYCYSGSSQLLYHPPPLKTRRLVTDNPCISPTYPPPAARIHNHPFIPLPNERFCRLPSLPVQGVRGIPFLRPPQLFTPSGFPYRPPFVPRPNVAHYMCFGDNWNRLL